MRHSDETANSQITSPKVCVRSIYVTKGSVQHNDCVEPLFTRGLRTRSSVFLNVALMDDGL